MHRTDPAFRCESCLVMENLVKGMEYDLIVSSGWPLFCSGHLLKDERFAFKQSH